MDALSDVLKSVRLEGAIYLNAEFTAPWCVHARYGLDGVRRSLGGDHVAFFHFFTEGRCQVQAGGNAPPIEVSAGDLVIFPHATEQRMGSDLRLKPMNAGSLMDSGALIGDEVVELRHGGGGTATRLVCGYVSCSRSLCRPLFDALPDVFKVPIAQSPAASLLREIIGAAVRESTAATPGAQSMLAKVSELLFVEAMRRYVESLPSAGIGWLAGVRDPHVGRALAALHAEPDKPWTVDALAREAASSRSALAAKFTALVGESPMQYLARWRLALAAQALRDSADAIGRIAERAGYESEASFSRAFRREFGMPPATWRKAPAVA